MGFECGFDRVKKFKDTDVKNVLAVSNYVQWRDNEWNRENYKTFFEYCSAMDYDYDAIPEQSVIEYYDKNRIGQWNSIPETIEYWCSSGRLIDSFMQKYLGKEDYIRINNDILNELSEWLDEKLNVHKLVPVQIIRAYKDEDNKVKTLFDCEGVEVVDEEGNRKFVNGSSDIIFVGSDGFDSEERYTLEKLQDTIKRMKKLLRGNIIWYWRSY